MELNEYWRNPCGLLSIPYWKQQRIHLPANMKILHQRDFSEEAAEGYRDQVYFRLQHSLDHIPRIHAVGFRMEDTSLQDAHVIADIISRSYQDIRMTESRVRAMGSSIAYCPSLWVMAREIATGQVVGCIIGEFDPASGEMSIEWVQVLPQFRRRGIGAAMVTEFLHRAPTGTRFVTVSGQVDNDTHPEELYRRCGFTGNDYWHILTKEY